MYKKIVLIILCFLVVISCSSPSNPDGGNNGDIGNNGDSGQTGGSTVTPPVLDEEAQKYGIDISQDDTEISKQIEEKLQEYYNEKSLYKVIFTGIPKNYMLKVNSSLAALTIKAAEKIGADNIIIDTKNIDFQNGVITELMFAAKGVSKKRVSFIFPDDKITVIEQNAFMNLDNIEALTIPNSVVSIGERAFQAIYSLKSLILDNKLQTIGDYAFLYLQSLRELVIPDSVISIGEGAFANSSLEKVTISTSVKEIKGSAFNTSRKLKTLIYLGTSPNDINYQNDSFLYCDNLKTLILPNVPNPDYNTWKNFLGCNFSEVRQQE